MQCHLPGPHSSCGKTTTQKPKKRVQIGRPWSAISHLASVPTQIAFGVRQSELFNSQHQRGALIRPLIGEQESEPRGHDNDSAERSCVAGTVVYNGETLIKETRNLECKTQSWVGGAGNSRILDIRAKSGHCDCFVDRERETEPWMSVQLCQANQRGGTLEQVGFCTPVNKLHPPLVTHVSSESMPHHRQLEFYLIW